jgi:hypothetical protein
MDSKNTSDNTQAQALNKTDVMRRFMFECSITFGRMFSDETHEVKQEIIAETHSKARYRFYLGMDSDESYESYFKHIKVKKLYECEPDALDSISKAELDKFIRVKEYRNVDFAELGMKIKVRDKIGKIVGATDSCNFFVDFGDGRKMNCHPHFETTYFDSNDNVIRTFCKTVA